MTCRTDISPFIQSTMPPMPSLPSSTASTGSSSPITAVANWTVCPPPSMSSARLRRSPKAESPSPSMAGSAGALISSKLSLLVPTFVSPAGRLSGASLYVCPSHIRVHVSLREETSEADRSQYDGQRGVELALGLLYDEFRTCMALAG